MKPVQRFSICFALVIGCVPSIASGDVINHEPRLKGEMVGLLAKLVTWPDERTPNAGRPLTIGIVGQDPFVDDNGVNYLANKVGDKTKINHFATAADIKDCHILVISKTADFKQCIANSKGKSVLVISESPGKAKEGAAINLVFDPNQNRIRMEINQLNAVREGLRISRGLLRSKLVDLVE